MYLSRRNTMTLKDYNKLADTLRMLNPLGTTEKVAWTDVVDAFCTTLQRDNARFNAELFRDACTSTFTAQPCGKE
jgi:hypothetical protein